MLHPLHCHSLTVITSLRGVTTIGARTGMVRFEHRAYHDIAGLRDAHVGQRLTRYFKQDNAEEITARDDLIKGYVKLHLNETTPILLDDKDGLEAMVGEMTLDKVPPKNL